MFGRKKNTKHVHPISKIDDYKDTGITLLDHFAILILNGSNHNIITEVHIRNAYNSAKLMLKMRDEFNED